MMQAAHKTSQEVFDIIDASMLMLMMASKNMPLLFSNYLRMKEIQARFKDVRPLGRQMAHPALLSENYLNPFYLLPFTNLFIDY